MKLTEKQWREFKTLKTNALDRYCASILQESAELCANTEQSSHERYLALYKLIFERNRAMAQAFDGHSRSHAAFQLQVMHSMELISDEELQRFGLSPTI